MLSAARIFGRKAVDCSKFGLELNGKRNFGQLLNVSEHVFLDDRGEVNFRFSKRSMTFNFIRGSYRISE